MDSLVTIWEMSLEPDQHTIIQEEIATGPFEPYKLDRDSINWN